MEPFWIVIIYIFISACSSWLWLSESYSCIVQITVCKKIWELASDTGLFSRSKNDQKNDRNGPSGKIPTHISFYREWFGRRTNVILKATIKSYMLIWKTFMNTIQKGSICFSPHIFSISYSIWISVNILWEIKFNFISWVTTLFIKD